ncbi:PREDICTED: mitochondria-eating protein-like isoform X3 [Branchiostoma belcheri]|uniref:Mitochondria-eating protein n=1 Tax=Branchiostoma belcheri TaxID=7741 RepID=A0A6P4YSR6_BRABE|nr:PREDICTED: mitochondria-eating protein-like isoform X3 [Branchiostoma belcheri]
MRWRPSKQTLPGRRASLRSPGLPCPDHQLTRAASTALQHHSGTMAESLRRMVNNGNFTSLQDKLEKWLDDYHINTNDQNVARACELVELNARVQGQLFTLLNLVASEGGLYGGVNTLKNRLLPWLSSGFAASAASVSADTSLAVLAEAADKDRQITEIQSHYEQQLDNMEKDLQDTKDDAAALKAELDETRDELDDTRRKSTGTMMATEDEIIRLKEDQVRSLQNRIKDRRRQLRLTRDESSSLRTRVDLIGDYERQVRVLRDEIAILRGERAALENGLPEPLPPLPPPRPGSPTHAKLTDSVRRSRLIGRYNDLFSIDRVEALTTLRRYIPDDEEMVQRIVFVGVQEAFHAAKMAFRAMRLRVRKNLAITHVGPETLEEAVLDYIVRNTDLFDVNGAVQDTIRAMNVNPKISFPAEIDFNLLHPFIREVCRCGWGMCALEPPLDISPATDAELYNELKYRRSYDSEFTAPLVAYHVWPALMEYDRVVVKGEAVTKRGASLSPRRATSPRPMSPSRSRSPSPTRSGSAMSVSSRPSSRSSPRPYSAASSYVSY